jgi:hypothetical protein
MEAPMTQPARQGSGILNFLVGLVCVAMTIAFGVIAAQSLGYLGVPGAERPDPAPTPIIRVVAPQPAAPAQSAPVEQPVRPAVPTPVQPAAVPASVVEQPAPPVRQIIIVKNGNDPAAAPIVIDRGTKRKSP